MKNLLFSLLLSFTLAPVWAQNATPKNVPQQVLDAFRTKYPGVTAVDWEKKGANFEVEYKAGVLEHKVLYSREGSELYHKEDLAVTDLPAGITRSLNVKYPDCAITEAEKLNDKGKISYSADIKTAAGERRELRLTEKGKIISDRID